MVKPEGTPTPLVGATVGPCGNGVGCMDALLGADEFLEGPKVEVAVGLGAVVKVVFGLGTDGAEDDAAFVVGVMV